MGLTGFILNAKTAKMVKSLTACAAVLYLRPLWFYFIFIQGYMKFEYYLDENDVLQLYLYTASSSERVRRKRKNGKFKLAVVFFIPFLLALLLKEVSASIIAFVVIVLTYFFYPNYESNEYVRYYQNLITELNPHETGKKIGIEFLEEHIYLSEGQSESKVHFSDIVDFEEIAEQYFIHLRGSKRLVLPKNKFDKKEEFSMAMSAFAMKHSIPQTKNLKWEWR
jgi:hypothetical protein